MKEMAQLDLRKIITLLSLLREMVKWLHGVLSVKRETLILFLSRFGDVSMTFTGVLEVRGEGQ